MKKMLCVIILLQACVYKPVVDTAGRSGTFDKSKSEELTNDLQHCKTLAKENTVANQRLAFARLQSKEAVAKLFDELGPRYKERPGGYLRVIKRGFRPGDKAPAAQIEFVQENNTEIDEEEVVSEETA